MGIKEKDLQTVEALNTGDFLRVVTSDGKSRKVDKDAVGGGDSITIVSFTKSQREGHTIWIGDLSYTEICNYLFDGGIVMGVLNDSADGNIVLTDRGFIEFNTGILTLYAGQGQYRNFGASPDVWVQQS